MSCWTVAMLVTALATTPEIHLSMSAIRGVLHQHDLQWGRPRLSMRNRVDPEKAQRQWEMAKAVVEAPRDAAIVYADESRMQLLPLIRAMWHWAGQQVRITTPGSNVTRALFGALEIRTGQWACMVRERMRKEGFIAFLEHLLVAYPDVQIILFVDNYSSHKTDLVRDWLKSQWRLQMCYLPKYCSHLNPVEQIWLRLKGKVAASHSYGSIHALLDAVAAFFDQMSPECALAWAAAV